MNPGNYLKKTFRLEFLSVDLKEKMEFLVKYKLYK